MTVQEKLERLRELQIGSLKRIEDIKQRYRADVSRIMDGIEKRKVEKLRAELGI